MGARDVLTTVFRDKCTIVSVTTGDTAINRPESFLSE
jgi:hypothetical protein